MNIYIEAPDGREFDLEFKFNQGSRGTFWDPPESDEIVWEGYAVEVLPKGVQGQPQRFDVDDFCVFAGVALERLEEKALEAAGDCDPDYDED